MSYLSPISKNTPPHRGQALRCALVAFSALMMLTSCYAPHDDGALDEADTRGALTHEDSVRLGLVLTADTTWEGTIDIEFGF